VLSIVNFGCCNLVVATTPRLYTAVGRLAEHDHDGDPCVERLMAAGVTKALVDLCSNSKDTAVLGSACGALANFSQRRENRPTMVEAGVVQVLAVLCAKSQAANVIDNSARALSKLAFGGAGGVQATTEDVVAQCKQWCARNQLM
jgi:hypothetical protein